MKKENIFLLLRFVVIAVIYFLSFSIFKEEFLLSYKVFVPALVIYFILLMICIFHNGGKTALIKVVIDVFFYSNISWRNSLACFFDASSSG